MKTTRILVPAMVLTAGALLTAQETPGQPPERKPEPPPPAPRGGLSRVRMMLACARARAHKGFRF